METLFDAGICFEMGLHSRVAKAAEKLQVKFHWSFQPKRAPGSVIVILKFHWLFQPKRAPTHLLTKELANPFWALGAVFLFVFWSAASLRLKSGLEAFSPSPTRSSVRNSEPGIHQLSRGCHRFPIQPCFFPKPEIQPVTSRNFHLLKMV